MVISGHHYLNDVDQLWSQNPQKYQTVSQEWTLDWKLTSLEAAPHQNLDCFSQAAYESPFTFCYLISIEPDSDHLSFKSYIFGCLAFLKISLES